MKVLALGAALCLASGTVLGQQTSYEQFIGAWEGHTKNPFSKFYMNLANDAKGVSGTVNGAVGADGIKSVTAEAGGYYRFTFTSGESNYVLARVDGAKLVGKVCVPKCYDMELARK